jgi:fibronectin-binding autotransporter adhesin
MSCRTVSIAPLSRQIAVVVALAVSSAGPAVGQTDYYWNAPAGGAGQWDLATANWSTAAGGPLNYTWTNSGTERANFGGVGGSVTLSTAITAYGLNFTADGFALAGSTLAPIGAGGGIDVSAGSTATINSVLAGTVGFTKTGTGTLVLGGANTFSGRATVSAGTVVLTSATALGGLNLPPNDTVVAAGATLQLSNGVGSTENLTLNGAGVGGGGALRSTSGNNGWGSPIALASPTRINVDAGQLTISNIVDGSDLTIGGAGTVRFTPSAPVNPASLTIDGSVSTSISLSFSIAGTITHASSGTLTLMSPSSPSSNHNGPLQILAGTVRTGSAGVLQTSTAMTLANAAGVTFDLNNFSQTIGSLTGGGATGGIVTLGSATLTLSGTTTATFDGLISGTGGLTKTGTGVQTLAGANTYSGATAVNAGTLLVNGAQAAATGPVTVASGATLGGTGTIGQAISTATVAAGGTIRGGAAGTVGTLTVGGNLILATSSTLAAKLQVTADTTTASKVLVGGTLNFSRPAGAKPLTIELQSLGLSGETAYTRTIATATGGILRNGAGPLPVGTIFVLGTDYVLTSPDFASFNTATLQIQPGNNLVLQFVPVPEPATVPGLGAGMWLVGAALLKSRRNLTGLKPPSLRNELGT